MVTSSDIENYPYKNLRPFIVSICGPIGKGQLCDVATNLKQSKDERYIKTRTTEADVKTIFEQDIPEKFNKWQKKRLLLHAHGGLVPEQLALQRAAAYSIAFLEAEVYPLSFIWHTGFYETLNDMFEDHSRNLLTRFTRPQLEAQPTLGLEDFFDTAKQAVQDWFDTRLETIARDFGRKQWQAMKDRAKDASTPPGGGAYIVLKYLKILKEKYPDLEIHVIGHSAGSIFHAYLVDALTKDFGLTIDTCTLWAPACRVDLFKQTYLPAINQDGGIKRFILSTLTETAELNDSCTNFYHKSILYLVSNALEDRNCSTPLLGMEKFIKADPQLKELFNNQSPDVRWLLSPNTDIHDIEQYSTAERHGEFSSDLPTLIATRYHITQSSRAHSKGDGVMG